MNTNISLFVILIGFIIISTITTQRIYICGKDDVWITSTSKHFKIQNNNTISFNLEIIDNKNASWKNTTTKKNDLHFKYNKETRYKIKCFNKTNNQLLSESYVNSPIDLLYDLENKDNRVFLNVFGFKNETKIKSIKMCMSNSIFNKDLCNKVNENWKNKNFKNEYNHSQPFTKNVTFNSTKLMKTCNNFAINSSKSTPIITEPANHTIIGLLQNQEGHQFYINFNNDRYKEYNTIQYNCLINETIHNNTTFFSKTTKESSSSMTSTTMNTTTESLTSSTLMLSTTVNPTEKKTTLTTNLKLTEKTSDTSIISTTAIPTKTKLSSSSTLSTILKVTKKGTLIVPTTVPTEKNSSSNTSIISTTGIPTKINTLSSTSSTISKVTKKVTLMVPTTVLTETNSSSDTSITLDSTDKLNDNLLLTITIASSSFIVIALLLTSSFFLYRLIKKKKIGETDEEATYLNSKTILEELKEYKTENEEEDNLIQEHRDIPNDFNLPLVILDDDAKLRTRYKNIIPYKKNCVKLQKFPYYINASYIPGADSNNKYIATQAPLESTLQDFWQMIWQENVEVIVMLTELIENNTEKCAQYWPVLEKQQSYGNVVVKFTSITHFIDFNLKVFDLQNGNECRQVKQMHYTKWPDHDIPISPQNFINFMRYFRNEKFAAPIVVHCSAGIGRTGVFVLCDYILDQHLNNIELNYPEALIHLRKNRKKMISKSIQYKLCHYVIEEINKPSRYIEIDNFIKTDYNDNHLKEDFEWNQNDSVDLIYKKRSHPFFEINKKKIRNKTPVLTCKSFLYLDYHPKDETNSNYINANKIEFGNKTFICTQNPLKGTVGDFWRLIDQEKSDLILVLQNITDVKFWPNKDAIQPVNYLKVTSKSQSNHVTHCEAVLNLSKEENNKKIELMYLESWKLNQFPDKGVFVSFVLESMKKKSNIVLVCSDGSFACGIFLTFVKVMEQIKLEQRIDFCSAISTLRLYRHDFVNELEQYRFLYDAMKSFVNRKENDYANVTAFN